MFTVISRNGGSNPPLSAKQKSSSNTMGSFTLLILFDAVYPVDCETGLLRLEKVKAVVNPGIENKGANLQVIGCPYEKKDAYPLAGVHPLSDFIGQFVNQLSALFPSQTGVSYGFSINAASNRLASIFNITFNHQSFDHVLNFC